MSELPDCGCDLVQVLDSCKPPAVTGHATNISGCGVRVGDSSTVARHPQHRDARGRRRRHTHGAAATPRGDLAVGLEADGEHDVDECGQLSQRLEGHARLG